MSAQIIDGKAIAAEHLLKLAQTVHQHPHEVPPTLAVILVGNDPASAVYVRKKRAAAEQVGIKSETHALPEETTTAALLTLIEQLNHASNVHGILIQLPLPAQINTSQIIEAIHPQKDVDGFHPYNLGRLAAREPLLRPCTPYGVMALLAATKIPLTGLNAVVVGASNIVGRPMALELLLKGVTVTICHRFTQDLAQQVQRADLLIACAGKPQLIPGAWIKTGAVVIDVGIHRTEQGTLIGDVEFAAAFERASFITPVPGGVGPMTVAMLMENTWQAFNSCASRYPGPNLLK